MEEIIKPKGKINLKMVAGMSQNAIFFDDGEFYIDFNNIATYFEKNKNLLDDQEERESLVKKYGNDIVGFFNDFKNVVVGDLEKLKIEKLEQNGGKIKVVLEKNSISKEILFILEILVFLYSFNKKAIEFYVGEEKIEYSILKSEEFILRNLLNKFNLEENQGDKINEEIENILIRLGLKFDIFNKIRQNFDRNICFGDLHKNEHFGLEFGGFSKANFLANCTSLLVQSGYLDNLTGFKGSFPDIVDTKKGVSSRTLLVLGDMPEIKIKSIEELLEKKLEFLLDGDLDNFEELFTNLGLIIFENLDIQNDFYQKLIGSKNNNSNNAIKLFLKDSMKKKFFLLFRGIKNDVLDEIKDFKEGKLFDISLLKRKILVIFNNFLNIKIYNQILSIEEKQEYIRNGILDENGVFCEELESAKYVSGKNNKYTETKQIINLFLDDEDFGEDFIYALFKNIFNSNDVKKVYLLTLNIDGKNVDFNLIEKKSKILINFGERSIEVSEFINDYFNSEFTIVSITGKLGNIKSVLNGDLVIASERGAREIIMKTFRDFLDGSISAEITKDLEKLILDLKLVDDFEEDKKAYEYNNFPVSFSEIIPQENVLLAYLLGDNLIERQLSNKPEKNIDLELEYQNKILRKINIYLRKVGLTREQAIKRIIDIKYFLDTENFGESKDKTDIISITKAKSDNQWISMEGFQLLMENKILEQEFVDPAELKKKLNGESYINVEMVSFEEDIKNLKNIYNNIFPEFKEFMEKSFLENIKNFYQNIDYNFDLYQNTYSSFLSKIQFYTTLSFKIFGKEKGIGNNIFKQIFTKVESTIITNLNIENYPDSMIFITNLERLGIEEFEYIGYEQQNNFFLEQINNSFDQEIDNSINIIKNIFKMKINFIKQAKNISFLAEKNDLIIHDYFERMIMN